MERNHIVAHDFITVDQEEDESDEGNTLPLCFEVFDIMRRGLKVTNQIKNQKKCLSFSSYSTSEIERPTSPVSFGSQSDFLMEAKQEHQYLLTMEERKQILHEEINDSSLKLNDNAMDGEFLEARHEYPFIGHEEEEYDMDDCHATQESTNHVTIFPLAEITSEKDLDDEFHDAFPKFEEHMHHLCQNIGLEEKDRDGQSIISLSPTFLDSLSQEVILGSELFHHEDSVATCHERIPTLPVVALSHPIVNEPVCHSFPSFDDYEDVFPEQLAIPTIVLSPSTINSQMAIDSPLYDDYEDDFFEQSV
jgi:hypothetical protein